MYALTALSAQSNCSTRFQIVPLSMLSSSEGRRRALQLARGRGGLLGGGTPPRGSRVRRSSGSALRRTETDVIRASVHLQRLPYPALLKHEPADMLASLSRQLESALDSPDAPLFPLLKGRDNGYRKVPSSPMQSYPRTIQTVGESKMDRERR